MSCTPNWLWAHCTAKSDLEVLTFLPLSIKGWEHRCAPLPQAIYLDILVLNSSQSFASWEIEDDQSLSQPGNQDSVICLSLSPTPDGNDTARSTPDSRAEPSANVCPERMDLEDSAEALIFCFVLEEG